MDRIELKVDPAVEAAEAVDELCSRVRSSGRSGRRRWRPRPPEELEALELPAWR